MLRPRKVLKFVTQSQHNEGMKKSQWNELIAASDIGILERNLLYSYLTTNSLNYEKSEIINNELAHFKPDANLQVKITELEIYTLKDLEQHLELLIPKEDRKLNGAFFTPTYIVNFIIENVNPEKNEKCLDPSCGCGAFLVELVQYIHKKTGKTFKSIIRENIFGSDILDYNVKRTKLILAITALTNGEFVTEDDLNIYHQDSLKADWKHRFDVIVGNPPYVKYQDLSDENRQYLMQSWSTIDNGTFNLYFAFFELGFKLLSEDGRLGFITPNNYFTSLAGLSLRSFFHRQKCLYRIIDFSHKKVFDAQTYTAITFLNNQKNESILFDKVTNKESCEEFLSHVNGSPNDLSNLNVKKWRLLKSDEQKNIKTIESIGTPIKQLFNIAVGIATLKDEVFFVDSVNTKGSNLVKTTENGTYLIEKEITKPVYKISNFKTQDEIESNTLRIITPYKFGAKTPVPYTEEEMERLFPNCYHYLLSEKEKLDSRDKGKTNYSPFFAWGRTQGIARFGKKILNPTFSKEPRFLYVPEKDAYYTNGYGIYFNKQDNVGLFEDLVHPLAKEENILIVQKILNSIVMHYYISKTSVSIQGGYPCYQKNFIEKFTLPDFSYEEIELLKCLNSKPQIDEFLVEKYQVNIPVPNLCS